MKFPLGHSVTSLPHNSPDMMGKSPVDFFNLLFSEEIKENIWTETTRFADQYFIVRHPRVHDWIRQPMTLKEVDALLSIIIAMGIVGYPTIRCNYYFFSFRSYWSQKWPFVNTNFSSIMSGRRFELLTK